MTLAQIIAYHGADSGTVFGLQPAPSIHPPSLRNPQQVKTPMAQDGWKRGDSKAARRQAYSDLAEIHKRMRRQTGKPELAHVANYPMFPNYREIT